MGRIVIAILFVLAVAAQNVSLGGNQDGFRLTAFTAQPSRLTEYAECDDADHNFFFLSATIVRATAALERLEQMAFRQSLNRTQHSDSAGVPLYELHAVWRI